MALLTPAQLLEISQIIQDHHSAWIVNTIGPEAVAAEVVKRLKAKGLVSPTISSIEEAYIYGQVVAAAEAPNVAGMSYSQFKDWVAKNPVQLTDIERDAIAFAQARAGQYCRGLGNRVDVATGAVVIEADAALRQRMRDEIMTATEANIARRESVKKLKSDLGWATKDWARDWDRIANTEKHFAMQRGTADYYAKEFGPDVQVAVRTMPDCCNHCERLYGPSHSPKIFKLSELEANGTNVGRKARDWLPTLPPLHPWCQCQVIRVPKGWGFNEEGQMVPNPKAEKSLPRPQPVDELGTAVVVPLPVSEADLEKATVIENRVRAEDIAYALPAHRRAPGSGTVANYAMDLPDRARPEAVDFRDLEEILGEYEDNKLVRDPEIYDVQEPFKPRVISLVIPTDYRGAALGTGETEENREHFDDVRSRDRSATRNTVDPEDSDQETQA